MGSQFSVHLYYTFRHKKLICCFDINLKLKVHFLKVFNLRGQFKVKHDHTMHKYTLEMRSRSLTFSEYSSHRGPSPCARSKSQHKQFSSYHATSKIHVSSPVTLEIRSRSQMYDLNLSCIEDHQQFNIKVLPYTVLKI